MCASVQLPWLPSAATRCYRPVNRACKPALPHFLLLETVLFLTAIFGLKTIATERQKSGAMSIAYWLRKTDIERCHWRDSSFVIASPFSCHCERSEAISSSECLFSLIEIASADFVSLAMTAVSRHKFSISFFSLLLAIAYFNSSG
jgi:hypothetical protein